MLSVRYGGQGVVVGYGVVIVGVHSQMGMRCLGLVIVGVVVSSVVSLFVMPRLLLDPWS